MGAGDAMASYAGSFRNGAADAAAFDRAERAERWLPVLREYQAERAAALGVQPRPDPDLLLMIDEAPEEASVDDLREQVDLALSWPASLPPPSPRVFYQMPGFGLGFGSTAMWITDWIDYCALWLLRRRLPPRPPARPRLL